MLTVEVITQRDVDPAVSHAVDVQLLELATQRPRRAWLRVYSLAGDVVSLGRYHLAPSGDPGGRVRLHRRLGGGRVLPLGPGFALLSLTLPHRSALVADEALALRPEQVLNRCVRALLAVLRDVGVDAFYPGRDHITVDRRMLGLVSLETAESGASVFEAVVAIDGDWLRLPALIAAADRDGALAAAIFAADQVTALAAHGATPTVEQLAACVAAALVRQFGVETTAGVVAPSPADVEPRAAAWLASRRRRPGLDRHAIEWGQLGAVEVYLATRGAAIDDIVLAGDFIADSPSIAALEQRLRGCARAAAAIAEVVDAVYADPHRFLLGIGPLQTLVDLIVRAA